MDKPEPGKGIVIPNENICGDRLPHIKRTDYPRVKSTLWSGAQPRTLELYRWQDTWAFDDLSVGLECEPLVRGAEKVIDLMMLLGGLDVRKHDRAVVTFSDQPFEGCGDVFLIEEAFAPDAAGGTWYEVAMTGGEEPLFSCWLCPALLKYFPVAPRNIYARVAVLEASR